MLRGRKWFYILKRRHGARRRCKGQRSCTDVVPWVTARWWEVISQGSSFCSAECVSTSPHLRLQSHCTRRCIQVTAVSRSLCAPVCCSTLHAHFSLSRDHMKYDNSCRIREWKRSPVFGLQVPEEKQTRNSQIDAVSMIHWQKKKYMQLNFLMGTILCTVTARRKHINNKNQKENLYLTPF